MERKKKKKKKNKKKKQRLEKQGAQKAPASRGWQPTAGWRFCVLL